jgi:hypothetical protein
MFYFLGRFQVNGSSMYVMITASAGTARDTFAQVVVVAIVLLNFPSATSIVR